MPTITGTTGPDTLQGTSGSDSISGGTGDDQISGGGGADTLSGGSGANTFIIAQGDSPTSAAVGGHLENLVHITDWTVADRLAFSGGVVGTIFNTVGIMASNFDSARSQADFIFTSSLSSGTPIAYVEAEIGADDVIFTNQHQAVVLSNVALLGVSPSSIMGAAGATASASGNFDAIQPIHLVGADIIQASATALRLSGPGVTFNLTGTGFVYDANQQIVGGTVTAISFVDGLSSTQPSAQITGLSIPVTTLLPAFGANDNFLAFSAIFSGNDTISGSASSSDLLRGYDGADLLEGLGGGSDSLFGGNGDDRLIGGSGADYLNGGAGADTLTGGAGVDFFEFGLIESAVNPALGGHMELLDHIVDWTSNDILKFTGGVAANANNYVEITAASFSQAAIQAQTNLNAGIDYTVAQVGADVIVFGMREGDAVVLSNTTLASISQVNLGGTGAATGQPAGHGVTVDLFDGADMGTFQESSLIGAAVTRFPTVETLTFGFGFAQMSITGTGFTYDSAGQFSGGTVTGVEVLSPNGHFVLTGAHTDATILARAFLTNDANLSISTLMAGDDVVTVRGSPTAAADTSFTGLGYGGNDLMIGGGSFTSFDGGDGADTLQAASAAQTVLRGGNGDDSIVGGLGFDDINGNKGDDTIDGGAGPGNDWLVGGQGNDLIIGHNGKNQVLGNLGNDTLHGGDGGDVVRGGQGDDSLVGGAGADFISGDRGNDTESGGLGADIFHSSQDVGIDRVLDFSVAQGDRVQLDPGTTFTVSQVGADTIIDFGGGSEMILVGVQMSSLPPGSIFGA